MTHIVVRYCTIKIFFFVYFLAGLDCFGYSFAYIAHFIFLKDVLIRTQRAAVASRRATNLATHLPRLLKYMYIGRWWTGERGSTASWTSTSG